MDGKNWKIIPKPSNSKVFGVINNLTIEHQVTEELKSGLAKLLNEDIDEPLANELFIEAWSQIDENL